MLQKTNDETLSTQAIENKRNKAISTGIGDGGTDGKVGGSIKNLSTITKLAKKLKSTKPKRLWLPNAKANFETDFLFCGDKKAFIHLQKAFTKAPFLSYFYPRRHTRNETDVSGFDIGGVLSLINLDYLDYLDYLEPLFQITWPTKT